jgi:glycosyltransferase involved in cell wall biosynthesis
MMKITFLAINYAPSVGGAQQLVQRIAEGLVQRHGHQVTVVTTDALYAPAGKNPGKIPSSREVIKGVEVLRLPVSRRTHDLLRALRRLGARFGRPIRPSVTAYGPWGVKLAFGARKAARNSDVVVGVSAPFTTLPAAEVFTRSRNTAAFVALPILHLGDWVPSGSLLKSILRADRCIALTTAEETWLLANGLEPSKGTVIPPGCNAGDTTLARGAAQRKLGLIERPTVVFIGRLAAHKGIDTLLAACPSLLSAHPDLSIVLAGSRTGWSGLGAALDAMPADSAERVVVLEDFAESDRDLILGAADIVVVPSREEAFGMVILEAWAAQRPVVASDIAAVRSVIRDGVDGLLVPVAQPEALATAVTSLLASPETAQRLGLAGQQRIAAEFSWEAVVDRWNEELVSVAPTQGRAKLSKKDVT